MKILLTFFVLFFSSSVFSRTIEIDCGTSLSWKITADDKVWHKSSKTDYQWKHDNKFFLLTDNGSDIVIGNKNIGKIKIKKNLIE